MHLEKLVDRVDVWSSAVPETDPEIDRKKVKDRNHRYYEKLY
jgi:hypothetical protein